MDFRKFLPAVKMPLVLCFILEGLTIAESPVRENQQGCQKSQMLVILTLLKPKTKYSFQLSKKTSKSSSALVSQNDSGRGIRIKGQETGAASRVTDQPCHPPTSRVSSGKCLLPSGPGPPHLN